MIRTFLKRQAMALLVLLAAALPAAATTSSTDFTDLWWNPSESGWGVNVIHQGDTFFATLFVYGTDGTARWFVASNLTGSGTIFSGTLYQTAGPYFGAGTFNPASVGVSPVGAMTFSFSGPYNGTLQYSVNGVNVFKNITRQTFRTNNLTGRYLGGLTANGTACSGVANGPILIFDNLSVTHGTNNAVTMTVNFFSSSGQASVCTFSGSYAPQGRLGAITNGTFSCTFGGAPGNSGTFTMDTVEAANTGFHSTFSGRDQFCTYNGYFGGLRDVL